jgi:hypothetical protein
MNRTRRIRPLPSAAWPPSGRGAPRTVPVDHGLAAACPGPHDHHLKAARRRAAGPAAGMAAHQSPARPAAAHHPAMRPLPGQTVGFWVSCTGGQTVRRPWCLSCCEGLDRDRCDVILFDS